MLLNILSLITFHQRKNIVFPKISIYEAMSFYNLPSVKTKRSTTL